MIVILSKLSVMRYSLFFFQYGFKRQSSTGTVKTDKVYGPGGKFMIGPDFGFKTFMASAHFMTFEDLQIYTWNKLEVRFFCWNIISLSAATAYAKK